MKRKPCVLTAIALAVLACDSSPLTPVASSVSSRQAPAEEPFTEVFEDVNPCTGNVVTYTFSGTARVRESGDDLFLVTKGTVATSDGFTGSFNRQFIINDNVTHLRFHDMEASSQTGQRIIFGVGLFHETTVNGESVVSFEQFSGIRCVGKG